MHLDHILHKFPAEIERSGPRSFHPTSYMVHVLWWPAFCGVFALHCLTGPHAQEPRKACRDFVGEMSVKVDLAKDDKDIFAAWRPFKRYRVGAFKNLAALSHQLQAVGLPPLSDYQKPPPDLHWSKWRLATFSFDQEMAASGLNRYFRRGLATPFQDFSSAARHRRASVYSGLSGNALCEHLRRFGVTSCPRGLAPRKYRVGPECGPQESVIVCSAHYLQYEMHANVDVVWGMPHSAWISVKAAVRSAGYMGFMLSLLLVFNIPPGSWSDDLRSSQVLGMLAEMCQQPWSQVLPLLEQRAMDVLCESRQLHLLTQENTLETIWKNFTEASRFEKKGLARQPEQVHVDHHRGAVAAPHMDHQKGML